MTAQADEIPKEQVEAISRQVFEHVDQALLEDGTPIGKEKAETLQYPLLPYDIREMMILRGTMSGMAEVCGMDWRNRNFGPLMLMLHHDGKFDQYQIAFAGLIHSASMAGGVKAMQSHKPCTDEIKSWLADNMLIKGDLNMDHAEDSEGNADDDKTADQNPVPEK